MQKVNQIDNSFNKKATSLCIDLNQSLINRVKSLNNYYAVCSKLACHEAKLMWYFQGYQDSTSPMFRRVPKLLCVHVSNIYNFVAAHVL